MIAPIVAGVDGSDRGLAAAEAAGQEAVLQGRPLRLVHAFGWPSAAGAFTPELALPSLQAYREQAGTILDEALRFIPAQVHTTTVAVAGSPAAVLRDESHDAHLLVLGDRGRGALNGLMLGSTAVRAAADSSCPVLVVRGQRHPGGPVVAGVDGSPGSMHALAWAAEAAVLRDAELVVLQAWNNVTGAGLGDTLPAGDEAWAKELALAEALAGLTDRHPGLRLRWQVRPGPARRVLSYWSREAQLMVVGDRGFGGFAGLLLGSVSQHLIHRSECPTVVVRPAPAVSGAARAA